MKFTAIKAGWMRRIGLAASLVTLALAGCGGGTEIDPFHPTRILSFGDEMNVITPSGTINGTKYTVNYWVTADTTNSVDSHIDCTGSPLWIQSVASYYGLAYAECPGSTTSQAGHIYAKAGAVVDSSSGLSLSSQIDNFKGTVGSFTDQDVVTVLVGMNDILAAYANYHQASDEAGLAASLNALGKQLAATVNSIALAGPAVIVSTVPDLGVTPFALKEPAGNAALLTRLTDAFNSGLRHNLINDGHLVGLVGADLEVDRMVQTPSNYALTNVKEPVCLAAFHSATRTDDVALLPSCTTSTGIANLAGTADPITLVTDKDNGDGTRTVSTDVGTTTAVPSNYLWAGNLLLSARGQAQLGSVAVSRASGNPF